MNEVTDVPPEVERESGLCGHTCGEPEDSLTHAISSAFFQHPYRRIEAPSPERERDLSGERFRGLEQIAAAVRPMQEREPELASMVFRLCREMRGSCWCGAHISHVMGAEARR